MRNVAPILSPELAFRERVVGRGIGPAPARSASRSSAGVTVFNLPSCSMHSLPTALYTNFRWGQCLTYVGTEGRGNLWIWSPSPEGQCHDDINIGSISARLEGVGMLGADCNSL